METSFVDGNCFCMDSNFVNPRKTVIYRASNFNRLVVEWRLALLPRLSRHFDSTADSARFDNRRKGATTRVPRTWPMTEAEQEQHTEESTPLNAQRLTSQQAKRSDFQKEHFTPARTRLAAPLLVEIYGRSLTRPNSFSSKQVFVDFITNLGKIAQEEEQDPGISKKAAKALLRALESTLHPEKSKVPASFLSPELLVVIPVLQNDSLFGDESYKEIRLKIIEEIQGTVSSNSNNKASTMDPAFPPDSLSASGIADRISPGSDPASSITNLLADIGPACTRNEAIFRETLQEFRRSSFGGIDEATMARLLYFFSTKGNNSNSMKLRLVCPPHYLDLFTGKP
ncbi:hypothetical protein MHU86_2078 [Fragilaria crotonensis]|nr:hypothetical protein MHU86_2078 [Fragilaria crotonensis]